MAKPLKVGHGVCSRCHLRVPLDDDLRYKQHLIYGDKLPNGEIVNSVCEGSGFKATRLALRMERKQVRTLQAIERRHAERERLKKDLEPEVEKLRNSQSIKAEAFIGLLKAHGIWDTVPPRRKNTIKDRMKCLHYDGSEINIIMHNSKRSAGIIPLAKTLLNRVYATII